MFSGETSSPPGVIGPPQPTPHDHFVADADLPDEAGEHVPHVPGGPAGRASAPRDG